MRYILREFLIVLGFEIFGMVWFFFKPILYLLFVWGGIKILAMFD